MPLDIDPNYVLQAARLTAIVAAVPRQDDPRYPDWEMRIYLEVSRLEKSFLQPLKSLRMPGIVISALLEFTRAYQQKALARLDHISNDDERIYKRYPLAVREYGECEDLGRQWWTEDPYCKLPPVKSMPAEGWGNVPADDDTQGRGEEDLATGDLVTKGKGKERADNDVRTGMVGERIVHVEAGEDKGKGKSKEKAQGKAVHAMSKEEDGGEGEGEGEEQEGEDDDDADSDEDDDADKDDDDEMAEDVPGAGQPEFIEVDAASPPPPTARPISISPAAPSLRKRKAVITESSEESENEEAAPKVKRMKPIEVAKEKGEAPTTSGRVQRAQKRMAQTEVEGSKVSTKKSGKRKVKESSDEEEVPTVKPPKKKRAMKEYKSKEFIESEDETPAPPSNLPAKTAGDSNDGVAKMNAPAKPVKQTMRMTALPHVAPKVKGKGKAKATAKGKATVKAKAKVTVSQKDMWKKTSTRVSDFMWAHATDSLVPCIGCQEKEWPCKLNTANFGRCLECAARGVSCSIAPRNTDGVSLRGNSHTAQREFQEMCAVLVVEGKPLPTSPPPYDVKVDSDEPNGAEPMVMGASKCKLPKKTKTRNAAASSSKVKGGEEVEATKQKVTVMPDEANAEGEASVEKSSKSKRATKSATATGAVAPSNSGEVATSGEVSKSGAPAKSGAVAKSGEGKKSGPKPKPVRSQNSGAQDGGEVTRTSVREADEVPPAKSVVKEGGQMTRVAMGGRSGPMVPVITRKAKASAPKAAAKMPLAEGDGMEEAARLAMEAVRAMAFQTGPAALPQASSSKRMLTPVADEPEDAPEYQAEVAEDERASLEWPHDDWRRSLLMSHETSAGAAEVAQEVMPSLEISKASKGANSSTLAKAGHLDEGRRPAKRGAPLDHKAAKKEVEAKRDAKANCLRAVPPTSKAPHLRDVQRVSTGSPAPVNEGDTPSGEETSQSSNDDCANCAELRQEFLAHKDRMEVQFQERMADLNTIKAEITAALQRINPPSAFQENARSICEEVKLAMEEFRRPVTIELQESMKLAVADLIAKRHCLPELKEKVNRLEQGANQTVSQADVDKLQGELADLHHSMELQAARSDSMKKELRSSAAEAIAQASKLEMELALAKEDSMAVATSALDEAKKVGKEVATAREETSLVAKSLDAFREKVDSAMVFTAFHPDSHNV
ncbi:hypothetical protein SCP_0503340 [Sparassis crispa]|uniref:Zn(2)-C6 fungal-type domain-containing protein n=1 Tax=Sparassis crispa TaxID=139825 RepID=A0A401GM67_9APHY|nr:hypothetical protein SCP_0503340 [Sparassis crispa]GBE83286.1 hypothetical protein SCP_0503340 [Sparassis crispa]